jgi:hypothetical protein
VSNESLTGLLQRALIHATRLERAPDLGKQNGDLLDEIADLRDRNSELERRISELELELMKRGGRAA